MGEIGINRKEFLYELKFWEIQSIIKGYRNRAHTAWETSRLNAYFIMSSMADLTQAGIHHDTDLIRFPWERKTTYTSTDHQPTAADVQRMREDMRRFNASQASPPASGCSPS